MTAPTPDDRELQIAKALADFVDLEARGESVDVEAFCDARPELEPNQRQELRAFARMGQAFLSEQTLSAFETPERLSGHKILSEIGAGGMGRVFQAFDERLGRRVAIKMLANRYWSNASLRTRFMQEARAMARLTHPHIVRIYNLGESGEAPHFVMEYVEGVPLTQVSHALSLHQKMDLMRKIVVAVDFLHQHHFIHRDLKPSNILVGADLQPKLLDFGLALEMDAGDRLTLSGDIVGTPQYFSPEQARADSPLDARSDVFSLGTLLYELLTGEAPFRADSLVEQVRTISEKDPVLPRRINPNVPGELQNICLKALEKKPVDRYGSAREMAQDLERFLAGEQPLAAPASYSRLMAGKIEQHVRELDGWKQDRVVSEAEYAALRRGYDRLMEREDAWIMEVRRLSLPQVSLYLGGWILVVGAALLVLFRYTGLSGTAAVLVAGAAAVPTIFLGIRSWRQGRLRIGVAYLLAFCLLLPTALLVAMGEYGLFSSLTRNNPDLELFTGLSSFKTTTNAQLWWALLFSIPVYFWLRRFTRSTVFSLVFSIMSALFCVVTLLRLGMLEWLDTDPGKLYFRLIPVAVLFFAAGISIERRRYPTDSRYFYPIAFLFTLISLSGIAMVHKPYASWLESVAPWTRGQVEYLFMINAGIYLALQTIFDRLPWPQIHSVGRSFRFVIPGHVLTPLLLLGMSAGSQREERTFEILLPIAACAFVFGSIPKQMKNFFVWGMIFLAIGIVRLQQDLFKDRWSLLLGLLLSGLILMLTATHYAAIKMFFVRRLRRNP